MQELRSKIANKLVSLDWSKWYRNTMIFLAPLALIYLATVGSRLEDGFQVTDLYINATVMGSMVLYVINVLTDFFLKFKNA